MRNHKSQITNHKEKSFSTNPLLKAVVLISFKESYLFVRNLYGLAVHPFKTTFKILNKPDWSQTFLVFGLPGYIGLGVLVIVLPLYFLFAGPNGKNLLFSFSLLILLSLLILTLYLAYWFGQYFYKCKFKQKN